MIMIVFQFKFVTPLTSMVVTRPNNSNTVGSLRDSSAANKVAHRSPCEYMQTLSEKIFKIESVLKILLSIKFYRCRSTVQDL